MQKKLSENSYKQEIKLEEIKNVLKSNKFKKLKIVLNLYNYKILIPKHNSLKDWLLSEDFLIKEYEEEDKYINSSEENYNQGILTIEDKDFILNKQLQCYEIAGFSDGWYSTLTDLEIYNFFKKQSIENNIHKILYHAILGKVRNINAYCSLYYLPGNIPRLLNDMDIEVEYNKLFNSFMTYINMSLLDLKQNG